MKVFIAIIWIIIVSFSLIILCVSLFDYNIERNITPISLGVLILGILTLHELLSNNKL
jgi:hypothetical protein